MTLHISQPPTQCINSYTDIIPYRVRKLPSIFLFYIPLPHFPFIFLVVMNTQRMLTDSIFLCREETNSISIDIHCAHFLYVSSLVLKIASLELSTDDTHTCTQFVYSYFTTGTNKHSKRQGSLASGKGKPFILLLYVFEVLLMC